MMSSPTTEFWNHQTPPPDIKMYPPLTKRFLTSVKLGSIGKKMLQGHHTSMSSYSFSVLASNHSMK